MLTPTSGPLSGGKHPGGYWCPAPGGEWGCEDWKGPRCVEDLCALLAPLRARACALCGAPPRAPRAPKPGGRTPAAAPAAAARSLAPGASVLFRASDTHAAPEPATVLRVAEDCVDVELIGGRVVRTVPACLLPPVGFDDEEGAGARGGAPPPPPPLFSNVCPYYVTIGCKWGAACPSAHPPALSDLEAQYDGAPPAAVAAKHSFALDATSKAAAASFVSGQLDAPKKRLFLAAGGGGGAALSRDAAGEWRLVQAGRATVFWLAWSTIVAAEELLGVVEGLPEPQLEGAAVAAPAKSE